MSHFSVAVIHPNQDDFEVEELLAPYDEGIQIEKCLEKTKDELIEEGRHYLKAKGQNPTDEEAYEYATRWYSEDMLDKEGNAYTTYNPLSKWDWYVVGGRFISNMKTKDGEEADEAQIKDIDFSPNPDAYDDAIRFWEIAVEGKPVPEGHESLAYYFYKPQYYLDFYKTKENYARINSSFMTHAVITPDGEWHEKGEMGWFGVSYEHPKDLGNWADSYYNQFFKDENQDYWVTIVDCHI